MTDREKLDLLKKEELIEIILKLEDVTADMQKTILKYQNNAKERS